MPNEQLRQVKPEHNSPMRIQFRTRSSPNDNDGDRVVLEDNIVNAPPTASDVIWAWGWKQNFNRSYKSCDGATHTQGFESFISAVKDLPKISSDEIFWNSIGNLLVLTADLMRDGLPPTGDGTSPEMEKTAYLKHAYKWSRHPKMKTIFGNSKVSRNLLHTFPACGQAFLETPSTTRLWMFAIEYHKVILNAEARLNLCQGQTASLELIEQRLLIALSHLAMLTLHYLTITTIYSEIRGCSWFSSDEKNKLKTTLSFVQNSMIGTTRVGHGKKLRMGIAEKSRFWLQECAPRSTFASCPPITIFFHSRQYNFNRTLKLFSYYIPFSADADYCNMVARIYYGAAQSLQKHFDLREVNNTENKYISSLLFLGAAEAYTHEIRSRMYAAESIVADDANNKFVLKRARIRPSNLSQENRTETYTRLFEGGVNGKSQGYKFNGLFMSYRTTLQNAFYLHREHGSQYAAAAVAAASLHLQGAVIEHFLAPVLLGPVAARKEMMEVAVVAGFQVRDSLLDLTPEIFQEPVPDDSTPSLPALVDKQGSENANFDIDFLRTVATSFLASDPALERYRKFFLTPATLSLSSLKLKIELYLGHTKNLDKLHDLVLSRNSAYVLLLVSGSIENKFDGIDRLFNFDFCISYARAMGYWMKLQGLANYSIRGKWINSLAWGFQHVDAAQLQNDPANLLEIISPLQNIDLSVLQAKLAFGGKTVHHLATVFPSLLAKSFQYPKELLNSGRIKGSIADMQNLQLSLSRQNCGAKANLIVPILCGERALRVALFSNDEASNVLSHILDYQFAISALESVESLLNACSLYARNALDDEGLKAAIESNDWYKLWLQLYVIIGNHPSVEPVVAISVNANLASVPWQLLSKIFHDQNPALNRLCWINLIPSISWWQSANTPVHSGDYENQHGLGYTLSLPKTPLLDETGDDMRLKALAIACGAASMPECEFGEAIKIDSIAARVIRGLSLNVTIAHGQEVDVQAVDNQHIDDHGDYDATYYGKQPRIRVFMSCHVAAQTLKSDARFVGEFHEQLRGSKTVIAPPCEIPFMLSCQFLKYLDEILFDANGKANLDADGIHLASRMRMLNVYSNFLKIESSEANKYDRWLLNFWGINDVLIWR